MAMTTRMPSPHGAGRPRVLGTRLTLPLVIACGASLSCAGFLLSRRLDDREMRARFERSAANRVSAVRRAVERSASDVEAIAAFVRASGAVDRPHLHAFTDGLVSARGELEALEWIPREDEAAVAASDAAWRDALRLAATSGQPVATARVPLAREGTVEIGVAVLVPVFRDAAGSPASRPGLQGFAVGAYRLGSLIEHALGYLAPEGIDVYAFDDSAPTGERFLYFHPSRLRGAQDAPAAEAELDRGLEYAETVPIANRRWRVVCAPIPQLLASASIWHPWAMLGSGLAMTALVAGYLLVVAARAARAREHAAQLLRAKNALEAESAERRLAQATSESASRQLESLRRYANDIFLLVATDGAIVQANDRALQSYGYTEEEILRLRVHDIRAGGCPDGLDERLRRAFAEDGFRFTTVHRRRDGSTFPVEVSTRRLEIDGQQLLQSTVRDLTAERAAHAALEYQATLLDNMYDAVVGIDAHGDVNAWNQAAERVFGWTRQEVMGRPLSEVVPTEYADGVSLQERLPVIAREGRLESAARRRTRSGEWLEFETTAAVVRDPAGAILGYVSVNHDVTQRKRVAAALRASQQRLHDIVQTANEGIWVVDAEGRTELVNRRLAEMFQIRPEDYVGRSFLALVPAEGKAQAAADLEAVQRGETIHREFPLRRPDGTELRVILSRNPLREPDGRVVGDVGVFTDITAHRRTEEQLLQAQKMEAVGQLASGIAHDFNNLLVVVKSCASFLIESLEPADPRRADAEEIKQAGDRAAQLVRQLLAFARRSQVNPVVVDLAAAVREVEKLLRRALGEDIALRITCGAGPCSTRIDRSHLEQILINLAVNARDAMPGGGELRIECGVEVADAAHPACQGLAAGRYATLTVSDDGCGMPPEVASRIFEPFFTTKEQGKGTGLGLSTVYGIVEQARGKIAVRSAPGRGTTFTVYLPACDEPQPPAEAPRPEPTHAGNGKLALVVEDEGSVRRVARRMLERNGFQVVEASNAIEAFRRMSEHAIDVALVDVVMPDVSGTDLAVVMREYRPGVPIVLMSGYSDRPLGLGVTVLPKPFTARELAAHVERALEAGRRRDVPSGVAEKRGAA